MLSSSPPGLVSRKRRTSEATPPITHFFPRIKKQRSTSESHNVSQKLEDTPSLVKVMKQNSEDDSQPLEYNKDELCKLLGVSINAKKSSESIERGNEEKPCLENLPLSIQTRIFTILDMKTLSSLALTSTTINKQVKQYVTEYAFYRRFQLDHYDFMNSSRRHEDDDFLENDPFFACGILLKSITITLDTDKRAAVFLNVCRNLYIKLSTSLNGFGRILDGMTQFWKFSERRVMVKAAILIDESLRENIVKVLTSLPEKFVGIEMKIRSQLTELFFNRNQDIEESSPDEIIEFGAWLSVLLKNFTEKYQGKLYYLLFGPTILCKTGEKIAWNYFYEGTSNPFSRQFSTNRSSNVMKTRMAALLNGIRALRIMSNARSMDMTWPSKKIYRLFLRVVEASSIYENWSIVLSSMALAIDTNGIFTSYLLTCCEPLLPDFEQQQEDAAQMICRVRAHLYSWSATPSTFLSEPLHHVFRHLSHLDGMIGGPFYESFLDKIWKTREDRIVELTENNCAAVIIQEEMQGQHSVLRLLHDFHDMMNIQRRVSRNIREDEALEHDEQEE